MRTLLLLNSPVQKTTTTVPVICKHDGSLQTILCPSGDICASLFLSYLLADMPVCMHAWWLMHAHMDARETNTELKHYVRLLKEPPGIMLAKKKKTTTT